MIADTDKIASFFSRYDFPFKSLDINAVTDSMLADMEKGLQFPAGFSDASMGMYPNWRLPPQHIPPDTPVIVIDAGGTNFRSCLITFDSAAVPHISDFEKKPMPGTDREYSCGEFFDAMASYIDRLKGKSRIIGFCFSYALEILQNGDGKILSLAKELCVSDIQGKHAGACLADALFRRGWEKIDRIAVLNDTAAALYAAALPRGKKYSSYAGLILGTGMNIAYIESKPVLKIADCAHNPASQIIVCESGMFDKLPRSRFDIDFDETTLSAGSYVFEKMCAGAYLGGLMLTVLKFAAADKLFSDAVCGQIRSIAAFSLQDADEFLFDMCDEKTLLGKILNSGTAADKDTVFRLLDAVIDRTARLTAALVAAVVIKSGQGLLPEQPVCVLCEGTTFHSLYRLKKRIAEYLDNVLTVRYHLYYQFVAFDNAVAAGTAAAAVSLFSNDINN
ncbi:MAG: hypothetical protein NC041_05510 [Bacteroides sp.]|nr:hypothetical protein [Prevotella sp.]MCM1407414.1 hexokinase [Treponema brennaborense]MCM1469904.1 hypothetical protein [Bacteroides sp.]